MSVGRVVLAHDSTDEMMLFSQMAFWTRLFILSDFGTFLELYVGRGDILKTKVDAVNIYIT